MPALLVPKISLLSYPSGSPTLVPQFCLSPTLLNHQPSTIPLPFHIHINPLSLFLSPLSTTQFKHYSPFRVSLERIAVGRHVRTTTTRTHRHKEQFYPCFSLIYPRPFVIHLGLTPIFTEKDISIP